MRAGGHGKGWSGPVGFFAIAAMAIAWLLWRERHFASWMDDDAFISFRYARNLARGHGLVFNLGERVEGFTNPLWTLLLAGLATAGCDLPTTARVLGVALSLATLPLVVLLGRSMGTSEESRRPLGPLDAMPILLLGTSGAWAVWAVSGLENSMGAFLVTAGFVAYFRFLQRDVERALLISALALALAALTHPSYAIFGTIVCAHLFVRRRSAEPRSRMSFVAILVAPTLAYIAWRLSYYGSPLPTTYYAKSGFSAAMVLRGAWYVVRTATSLPAGILAIVALPMVSLRGEDRDDRPLLLCAGVLAYGAYVVRIGGESFPATRSYVVFLPILHVLTQFVATRLIALVGATRTAALAFAAIGAHAVCANRHRAIRLIDDAVQNHELALFTQAGAFLKRALPPGATLAHSGAGVVAFYSELPFIDTLGLTDAHIARSVVPDLGRGRAGHEKGDARYVLSRRPDYVMFSGSPVSSWSPMFRADQDLIALPEFARAYRRVELHFTFHVSDGQPDECPMPIYRRIDLPEGAP